MAQLAIAGGKPVRPKNGTWAKWPVSDEADAKLMAEVTRSNSWSYDGKYEWQFAEKFVEYQRGKFGLCNANGTVGIQMALEALGIGAYDEVIVPGMTWQATAAACVDVNAVPVLVDVEPDTWNLDLAAVEAAITKKTRAVIVVHLYGGVTDIAGLQKLCKKHGLFLIEDCAHQHGTFWKGQGVGTFGDVSSFSFQQSKVLSSGEGGFNICKTKELFYKLYSLRNCGRNFPGSGVFGLKKPSGWDTTLQSGNYRLTEWQAVMLLGGLRRLDKQVKLRDANAMYANGLLEILPGILPMRRRKEVTQQSYFNFTFRIDAKELGINNAAFCAALNAELGHPEGFEMPYDPLHECGLYKPRTKVRHKLNDAYWKAIDPRRFNLPVCHDANQSSGVAVHHAFLMNTKREMEQLAEACKKISDNIAELKKLNIGPKKKYKSLND